MKLRIYTLLALIVLILSESGLAAAQNKNEEPAASSNLLEVNLPAGAVRLNEAAIPAQFQQLLTKLVEGGGPGIKQGRVEVLVWAGNNYNKTKTPRLIQETAANLKTAGWNYEVSRQTDDLTLFAVSRTAPKGRAAVGLWVKSDEALVFALTEMLRADATSTQNGAEPAAKKVSNNNENSPESAVSGAEVFNLAASENYVNVMGSLMPKLPVFPALVKKPGKARGYVKDLQGNPLEGAYIGVRSSAVGGFYSGAQVETDANGYYEIDVPWGAAEFYAAGYTIDYGEGRAAVSLYPADGKAGSFASAGGTIENFVLVYHGLGDRNALSEKPWDEANYYGGAIRVSYSLGAAGDMWASKGSLPENAEIEITLAPEGALLDGSAGKAFVIRRKTGGINNFNINNIPVGRYRISARLTSGKQLKMRKTGYDSAPLFGLKPGEATGTAALLFVPFSAEPRSGHPSRGNWRAANVELQLP